jgi:hypothetical protein
MENSQRFGNQEVGYDIDREISEPGQISGRVGLAGALGAMSTIAGIYGFAGIFDKVAMANWRAGLSYSAPLETYIDSPGRLIGTIGSATLIVAGAYLFHKAVKWYRQDRVLEITSQINEAYLEDPSAVDSPKYREELAWLKERGIEIGLDSPHLEYLPTPSY